MFCVSCGSQNEDGRAACWQCGAPLELRQPVPAAPAPQMYGQQNGFNQAPQGGGNSGQQMQGVYSPQGQPVPQGVVSAPPVYQEGCVSAAWKDIKGTPGWIRKILLLGLMNCVPILNFAVVGYGLQWGRSLVFGERGKMPTSVFGDRTFSIGFFAALFGVIAYFILGMAMGLLGMVTFGIATFAFPVIAVFAQMFINVCLARMAVMERFSAGFELSQVWWVYKRSLGSLFCATVVPSLLTGLIAMALYVVIALVFGLLGFGGIMMLSFPSEGLSSAGATLLGGTVLGGTFVLGVIGLLIFLFAGACGLVITYRAMGHLIARVAPEWAAESHAASSSSYNQGTPFSGGSFAAQQDNFSSYGSGMPGNSPASGGYTLPVNGGSFGGYAQSPASAYPQQAVEREEAPGSVLFPQTQKDLGVTTLGEKSNDGATTVLDDSPSVGAHLPCVTLRRPSGQQYEITVFPATIGKGSAANVRIDGNDAISRAHVRICNTGTSFILEDLGATNRTYLNGEQLAEGGLVVLKDGDSLRLGDEVFTVSIN